MTTVGGDSPLLRPGVHSGGEAANLISNAQVTPVTRRPRRPQPSKGRSAKLHDVRNVVNVAARAMSSGLVFRTPISGEWDISSNCENAVPVTLTGRAGRISGNHMVKSKLDKSSYELLLQTRCRKCPSCLRARSRRWAHRSKVEIEHAPRTWFGTFTLNPFNAFMLTARTSARLTRGGTEYGLLSPPEQFAELVSEYGAELTKYLKRLRKNTGAPFRYILVAERHKSGVPHWHCLIHEQDPARPIRHASLTAGYKLGFTQFKLCDDSKTAWYVAKYLSKSAECRVRASKRYGSPSQREEITTSCPSDATLWPSRDQISPLQNNRLWRPTTENIHEVPSTHVLQRPPRGGLSVCQTGEPPPGSARRARAEPRPLAANPAASQEAFPGTALQTGSLSSTVTWTPPSGTEDTSAPFPEPSPALQAAGALKQGHDVL